MAHAMELTGKIITPEQLESALLAGPGLYRITDAKSGRFYIGSSVDVARRWKYHCYRLERGTHPNPILQAIFNSDPERLQITVISVLPTDAGKDAILAAEQAALDAVCVGHNSQCMNVLPVAGSHLGAVRSGLTKERLSEAQRGKKASAETRQKMRDAKLRNPLPLEFLQKLGRMTLGRKVNRKSGGHNPKVRRFSDEQVRTMRAMKAAGASYQQIEQEMGVSRGGLQKILNGKTYRDVT